jgi:glycerophosphoryl diester phosphodiesterase
MSARGRTLLLGHRGARATKSIPENTFASFDLALAHGCDGFECDVRRTADGRAVICHDPEYQGMKIADSPRSALDLPELQVLIARYASRAFLDIELKVAGLEDTLMEALSAVRPEKGVVVSSFLPGVIESLSGRPGRPALGIIFDRKQHLYLWKQLPVEYVIAHHSLVGRDYAADVRASKRKLLVWTVNAAEEMKNLLAWKVAGIISDDTEKLVRTCRG